MTPTDHFSYLHHALQTLAGFELMAVETPEQAGGGRRHIEAKHPDDEVFHA